MEQENKNTYKNCLHLYKLLSPKNSEANFNVISELIYEDDENLSYFTQKAEVPAKICNDDPRGVFLCCEFNRDGDSYRSPISNKYYPTPEDESEMKSIPESLRNLELKLNKAFKMYTQAYYSGDAICSVFIDSTDDDLEKGFLVNVRIKNPINDKVKNLNAGCWDSNNIIEVKFIKNNPSVNVEYKIASSAYLTMQIDNDSTGKLCNSGYSIKTKSVHYSASKLNDEFHIEKIGELVEEEESYLTSCIQNIYIQKSKEIIDHTRHHPIDGKPNIEMAMNLKNVFFNKK